MVPTSREQEEPMSTSADGKRTALVTGANSGLGKAITLALAADGMRVGLVARDRVRGESALEEIRAATGNDDLHLFVANLADQSAIRALAQAVRERFEHLHLLVNNAGTAFPERRLSPDGIECALAVNHLGPFIRAMAETGVRPEGACHQWRKVPPRELSIDLEADERFGWATGRIGAS
jgi:NAD(P)-dependent dehydrogenase (short-subunit alcohol dehydrogenase family)